MRDAGYAGTKAATAAASNKIATANHPVFSVVLTGMQTESSRLDRWLETLVQRGASDLFLIVGLPPAIRVTGKIKHLEEDPLRAAGIETTVLAALSPQAAETYRRL